MHIAGTFLQRCHRQVQYDDCEDVVAEHCNYLEFLGDHSAFCDIDDPGSCGPGDECTMHTTNPYFGYPNFDSMPNAMMVVMQIMTKASWTELMHVSQETAGPWTIIYYIIGVVLGNYFMMNLFVAVMNEKFDIASVRCQPPVR